MQQTRWIEITVGFFMLLGILALLMLGLQVSGLSMALTGHTAYEVSANFDNIGDLRPRAPVTIAGVHIGEVKSISLNPTTFKAIVTLTLNDNKTKIPDDSSASIYTAGILGSNYIELTPGFDDSTLHQGSVISATHSALILENLIGQLVYKLGGSSDSSKTPAKAP